jgi:hypothetical protein
LPEPANVRLQITDLAGQTVLVREAEFGAGMQQWRLDQAELPAAGVYFYKVQVGESVYTRRMILAGP